MRQFSAASRAPRDAAVPDLIVERGRNRTSLRCVPLRHRLLDPDRQSGTSWKRGAHMATVHAGFKRQSVRVRRDSDVLQRHLARGATWLQVPPPSEPSSLHPRRWPRRLPFGVSSTAGGTPDDRRSPGARRWRSPPCWRQRGVSGAPLEARRWAAAGRALDQGAPASRGFIANRPVSHAR